MHELSIAGALVELAVDAAERAGAARILAVRVEVGPLSGIVPEALRFAWPVAARETRCAGARLDVLPAPLVAHCPRCATAQPLADVGDYRCPVCGEPCGRLISGRELNLVAVEVEVEGDDAADPRSPGATAEEE